MKIMDKAAFEKENHFGLGKENTAYAQYFDGMSYLNGLTDPACGLAMANVTFEPGCRNHWHIHHAKTGGGQMLICPKKRSRSSMRSTAAATQATRSGTRRALTRW